MRVELKFDRSQSFWERLDSFLFYSPKKEIQGLTLDQIENLFNK